ncbi:MAG: VOC family protein [Solirubrobacterales bacterium]|nr:VOC family protein [Solirubrobacterales bacterium]
MTDEAAAAVATQGEAPPAFIGNTIQVSVVTDDLYRGIDQLVPLGIGPFAVFRVTPENCTEMRYDGKPAEYSMTLAFTTTNNMMWEVVQPHFGPNIYQDFLDAGHFGLHHVGADIGDIPYEERIAGLVERGYTEIQGGVAFNGDVPFAYFHNGSAEAPIVEIFQFPDGFDPQPDEIYPAPAA